MTHPSREPEMTRERAFGRVERIRDHAGETGDIRTVQALDVLLALVASEPSPALATPGEADTRCTDCVNTPLPCMVSHSGRQLTTLGTGAQTETPHDEQCEAELTSHGYTPCRCGQRPAQLLEDLGLTPDATISGLQRRLHVNAATAMRLLALWEWIAALPESFPPSPAPAICTWEQTELESTAFSTACGRCFEFTDGGPADNSFRHCPYCGKPLTQVAAEAEDDDGE